MLSNIDTAMKCTLCHYIDMLVGFLRRDWFPQLFFSNKSIIHTFSPKSELQIFFVKPFSILP